MRVSLRQTTRHCRLVASTSSTKVKTSGIPTGLITSSAAPVFEKLRTVQLIPPPPNVIVPAFNTRCLGAFRPSSMAFTYALEYRNGGSPTVNVFRATRYHERDHSRILLTRPVAQPSNTDRLLPRSALRS